MNEPTAGSLGNDLVCGMEVYEATALHAKRDEKILSSCIDHCRQSFLSASAEG